MSDSEKYEKPAPLPPALRAEMLENERSLFLNVAKFEQMQRAATVMANSDLLPTHFRGKTGNVLIALDLADRMNVHPLMLMQSMYVVHGRPGFEGKLVSALINNSGRYAGPLRYEWKGEQGKDEWGCRAYATLKQTDERIDGPWVDWKMVCAEKWDQKDNSKWKTMPELMFMYRAASFFGKTNDSDLLMGMSTVEELQDSSVTMVQSPDGSFTDGGGEKTADMYQPNKTSPEKEEVEPGADMNQEQKEEAPGDPPPWEPGTWNMLKATGTAKYAMDNKDSFKDQPKEIRTAFEEKWKRVCQGQIFPFMSDGAWAEDEII